MVQKGNSTRRLIQSLTIIICLIGVSNNTLSKQKAKYEPPENTVLIFVGQDNASVGGTEKYNQGYIDKIHVPAGITHYIGFGVDENSQLSAPFKEVQYGAGPMCLECYLASPKLEGTIMHLSIWLGSGHLEKVVSGERRDSINALAKLMKKYAHIPFMLRIGFEFDNVTYGYTPDAFKKAFRIIVDGLKDQNVSNFATVLASVRYHTERKIWNDFYPGDDYVDWLGYTYWYGSSRNLVALEIAREKKKPIFIAEATIRHRYLSEKPVLAPMHWEDWFEPFFAHIEENKDVIKAISYISADWDSQEMWTHWGDTRIHSNSFIEKKWKEKMALPNFINKKDNPYKLIEFKN